MGASGDDLLTLPMMAVGADGVISVASNVAPKAVADLVRAAADGRWDDALALHRRYYRLFTRLFLETNPSSSRPPWKWPAWAPLCTACPCAR